MPSIRLASAARSVVSTNKSVMAADGVEVCTVYINAVLDFLDDSGEPYPIGGVPASLVTVAIPEGGVTITQPTGNLDASGNTTATFTASVAGDKTVNVSINGLQVEGSPVVDAGGSVVPPAPGDPFYTQPTTEGNTRQSIGGFSWSTTDADVTEQVVPAGRSGYGLRFRFGPDASGEDSNAEQRFNMGRQLSHVWIEYDLYIPDNFAHRNESPNNNKFAMFWRTTYSDVTNGTWRVGFEYTTNGTITPDSNIRAMSSRWNLNSWTSSNSTGDYLPTGQSTRFISDTGPLTPGAWNQVRIELAAATDGASSDGIQRMWINGVLFLEITTGKFWNYPTGTDPEDCWLQNGYLLGAANSGFAEETDLYVYGAKFYDADPGWDA